MSTQSSGLPSIPFSITTPPQHVRLLELPPDLLELIAADDGPEVIHLKSFQPSNSSGTNSSQPAQVHLCTANKAWVVKQVSTSNSVHLITPSSHHTTATFDSPTSNAASTSLTSISLPTSHLELLSTNSSEQQILSDICSIVPLYPYENVNHHGLTSPATQNGIPLESLPNRSSNSDLCSHLPYPHELLAPLIRQSLIFSPDPGVSTFRPSPALQLAAWRALYQHVISQSLTLAKIDLQRIGNLISQIASEDGEAVAKVAQAITKRFTDSSARNEQIDRTTKQVSTEQKQSPDVSCGHFKPTDTILWLGQLLVQCSPDQHISSSHLLSQWTALVPSEWEDKCSISMLVSLSEGTLVEEGDMVKFNDREVQVNAPTTNGNASKAATGKRKWHERFGAQRNR